MLRALIALPLLLIIGALIMMRSPLIERTLKAQIEPLLGCEFNARGTVVAVDGRIIARGVSLRVPGMAGPTGEFLSARRAEIDADWSGALVGSVRPRAVRLYDTVFRVVVSSKTGRINIAGLNPVSPPTLANQRPRIDVVSGFVEFDESEDLGPGPPTRRVLANIAIAGSIIPIGTTTPSYSIRLYQTSSPAGNVDAPSQGLILDGQVDFKTADASLRLLNINLDEWPASSIPSSVRSLWERLNIQGRISEAAFRYTSSAGIEAVLTLDNVAMRALVPADPGVRDSTGGVLTLQKVNGTITLSRAGIRAEIDAVIENQRIPSHVELTSRGVELDAPVRCQIVSRGFRIEKDPALLPLAPPAVREKLALFSGPTAVVDAKVLIERGAPGPNGPAPFAVSGSLDLRHGSAAFEKFPYPFSELTGRIEFDDEAIRIDKLEGRGPTGAALTARGVIAPPDNTSEVTLNIHVDNVPVDDVLERSMPEGRAGVVSQLFDRDHYQSLLASGLVLPPPPGRPPPGKPVFDFGGLASFDVHIHTPRGRNTEWDYTVDVLFPRAGILPRKFPLPVEATDLHLEITPRVARIVGGEFRSLTGGPLVVEASIELEVNGAPGLRPHVKAEAHSLPIDQLLVRALPVTPPEQAGSDSQSISLKHLIDRLGLTGTLDCTATLEPGPDDEPSIKVRADLKSLTSNPAPPGGAATLRLTDINGQIILEDEHLRVPSLTCVLRPASAVASSESLGTLSLWLDSNRGKGPAGAGGPKDRALHAGMSVTDLDVASSLEDVASVYSDSIAQTIRDLRQKRQPAGRASAEISLDRVGDDPAVATVRLTGTRDLSVMALGSRASIALEEGSATVQLISGKPSRLEFENALVRCGLNDETPLEARVHGAMPFPGNAPAGSSEHDALDATMSGAPFESGTLRALLGFFAAKPLLDRFDQLKPHGIFDATVHAVPKEADPVRPGDAGPPAGTGDLPDMAIRADVLPRSIELTLNGTTVAVPHIRGRISIDEGRGEVDALTLEGDQWRSDVTGAWRTDSGTLTAHADVSFDADGFPDSLRVALPEAARKALDSAHLRLPGPTSLHDGKVNLVRSPDKALNGVEFSGRIAVSDAALSPAGVQITGLNGGAEISMEKRGAAPVHLDTSMLVDRVKVANVPVTSLRARLVSGSEAGEWILPLASADCFGGRVACSAMTHMGATRQYQAEVTLGGVPLSSVLRAMDRKADSKSKAEPDPRPDRGNVDASFAIAGASGDPSSKRAVGSVRISGGEVVTMPLVLSLIQVSNFQLPSSDRFDFLQSKFHLAGNRVDFDQVALLSNTVSVTGSGSMEWPSEKIDMQFNSQSNRRVPVWTDIVEVIRNEVMTTHVGGTLSEPKVGVEPLSATRRLIGSVLGFSSRIVPADPMTESDARRERDRLRASRRIPPVWRAGAPPAPPTRVPE